MTEDDDILAFEYVLGTAQGRDAIGHRITRDPAFAAQVQMWETRLSALNGGYAEAPAPDLLPRIEARMFGRPSRRRILWGMGGLAAACAAGLLVLPLSRNGGGAVRLSAPDQPLVVTASVEGDVLRLARVAGPDAPTGRSYEAWIIRPGAAPVSVGLLPGDTLDAAAPDLPDGTIVAISLEPQGGSPTGQPTGPVILSGALKI